MTAIKIGLLCWCGVRRVYMDTSPLSLASFKFHIFFSFLADLF